MSVSLGSVETRVRLSQSHGSSVSCLAGSTAALPCEPVGPWPWRLPLSAPQCLLTNSPSPGAPGGSEPCRLALLPLPLPTLSPLWNLLLPHKRCPRLISWQCRGPHTRPRLLHPVTQPPRAAVGAPGLESCSSVVHLDFQWPLLPPVTTPPLPCHLLRPSPFSLPPRPALLHCPAKSWYLNPDDVVLC